MNDSQIPYLVGGGYALDHYTGIARDSKDLDLLLEPAHARAILKLFSAHGYRTELCFPHWLGRVFGGDDVVDIIFSSGNGLCRVDNAWFEHAVSGDILGVTVKLCPAEELIWTKGSSWSVSAMTARILRILCGRAAHNSIGRGCSDASIHIGRFFSATWFFSISSTQRNKGSCLVG